MTVTRPTADRRRFLLGTAALGTAAAFLGRRAGGAETAPAAASSFPQQDPALVRETVGASHANLERVRELVTAQPALAKATIDWGFGDWETALGAASHTGRHEIARFLLAHGARPTLFSAAMLGQLEVVRAMVAAHPGAERIPGPHGISLLAHARAGGEEAVAVVAYLETLDGADGTPPAPLADADRDRILGRYRVDGAGAALVAELEVALAPSLRGERLALVVGEGPGRWLVHRGELLFHPVGAEAVRVSFRVDGGERRLRIEDGPRVVDARGVD